MGRAARFFRAIFYSNEKRFFLVEDCASLSIWADLLHEVPRLPSKPRGWKGRNCALPTGDWTLCYVSRQQTVPAAFRDAGISEPESTQLPAIFCLHPNGITEATYNCQSGVDALAFVRRQLARS